MAFGPFTRQKSKQVTQSPGVIRPDGGVETEIDLPGLASRIAQAARYVVSSVKPNSWMSPNQPLSPAVPETAGRAFDFPVGINLQIQPRSQENISFQQLRDMAEPSQGGLDLLRLLIETRKDQMVKLKWAIKPIDPEKKVEGDARIAELQNFFRIPDGVNAWQKWLRQIIEEMLVTDAVTIYPRMTRSGELFALEQMDGATIKRVIGEDGRTPLPPDPAYQQILKGIPASDYTSEQLIYYPRNNRVNKLYGFSPVEQIITTINIAIRRQTHQLQYYVNGNLPDLLLSMPKDMSQEGIERFMRIWEARLNGNLAARRQAMPIPDGTKPYDMKEQILKDEMDEWVARICCYAFSISPQPFIKMVNRGNQESMQEASLQEGLVPLMEWLRDLMNIIIWKYKGYLDLEFGWVEEEDLDPNIKSQIQDREIKSGKLSIDEARQQDGMDPIGMPNAVITATGPVMLKPYIDGEVDGTQQDSQMLTQGTPSDGGKNPPPKARAGVQQPTAQQKPKPPGKPSGAKTMADARARAQTKMEKLEAAVSSNREIVNVAKSRLASAIRLSLRAQGKAAASRLSSLMVKYSPDQPRDERGRWTAEGGAVMVSPNTSENMDFGSAMSAMSSKGQADLAAAANQINKAIGINATVQSGIGAWSDGAENSLMETVTSKSSYEDIRASAAMQGLLGDQKAVLPFKIDAQGKDALYQMTVSSHDLTDVHSQLLGLGVEFHTLIPDAKGTKIAVFDGGSQMANTMNQVAEHFNVSYNRWTGQGEILGSFESRAEGATVFNKVISEYTHGRSDVAGQWQGIRDNWRSTHKVLVKDDPSAKIDQAALEAALADLPLDWGKWSGAVQTELELVYADAGQQAVRVLIGEDGLSQIILKLNQGAQEWAQARAAEMVGMKFVEGVWVENPNPVWAISDSTRNMLRETVTRAYDQGQTPTQLMQTIRNNYAFSDDRAAMIASTELKLANNNGSMNGFRETGLTLQKKWLLSNNHDIDDPCDDNVDDGWIDLDDTFSTGDDVPPNHPRCECSYTVQTAEAQS